LFVYLVLILFFVTSGTQAEKRKLQISEDVEIHQGWK